MSNINSNKNGCLGCFGLIIVVAIIMAIVSSCNESNKPEHDKISASVMAEQFVKERLKAPSTAKFPWDISEQTKDLGNGRYRVTSYVDAQNSFGAMIRTNFSCVIQYKGDGKWSLESLDTW